MFRSIELFENFAEHIRLSVIPPAKAVAAHVFCQTLLIIWTSTGTFKIFTVLCRIVLSRISYSRSKHDFLLGLSLSNIFVVLLAGFV
jgi:hypothetical protein